MDRVAQPVLEKYLIEEATLPELHSVAFGFLLSEASEVNSYNDVAEDREKMWALSKRMGVDADAIAKKVEADLDAAEAASEAAQNRTTPVKVGQPAKKASKKAATKRTTSGKGVDGKSAGAGERIERVGA